MKAFFTYEEQKQIKEYASDMMKAKYVRDDFIESGGLRVQIEDIDEGTGEVSFSVYRCVADFKKKKVEPNGTDRKHKNKGK